MAERLLTEEKVAGSNPVTPAGEEEVKWFDDHRKGFPRPHGGMSRTSSSSSHLLRTEVRARCHFCGFPPLKWYPSPSQSNACLSSKVHKVTLCIL